MTDLETKHKIEAALKTFSLGNLSENALALFSVLGYNTDRQAPLDKPNYANFKETFFISQSKFNEEKARVKDWQYVDLLFQLSKEEIRKQISLFDTKKVDQTIIETYLFFAISLSQDQYSRTELSNITREVNRLFPMPVMILFKHGQYLTLAVINRRQHKRDENKDVLEKITLIKDIRIENPHRAHIEILFDLSFDELQSNYGFTNFVELHNAWQKTLDTKELNKRFYSELSNWYFWAMDHVSFPDDVEKDKAIRNATSLIRLITRIIFIWFIKEKSFVPDTLFDRREMGRILKAFEKNPKSDSYYRAILQNLFFGTLNQQMNERGFARDGSFLENKNNYGVKNLFRYAGDFAIAEKEVLVLFKDIPFLNGGLFDCLDKENDEDKVVYGDGFSRNPKKQAVVPDFLFFGDEEDYDLNTVYGTRNKRYKVKGLFNILSAYKFTVAENTPVEEEIALDPELLGRVFENLLASYNPEIQTTARKQTGSFYTPREIVNYMVDESLKAYLKQKLEDETGIKPEDAEAGLEILFTYTEKEHAFTAKESKVLIAAIDNCKILDPACGSGAFPMGVLHKLVHILHKLDPQNEKWKERQISRARQLDDPAIREKTIEDIESAFANNELDYGRKLYLIENCIYGVDIQPIAVQIAKLRFFISLVVDQKKNSSRKNLGILSLPNLETKFVAANTLIGLDKPQTGGQISFKNPEIEKLEDELKALRHHYFTARRRREKLACQQKDRDLRKRIATLLVNDGWKKDSASQVAAFDPYDQNASSPFFDPEWMFGIIDGFDLVVGNPPYIKEDVFRNAFDGARNSHCYQGKMDLWYLFGAKSIDILKVNGILCFIATNNWISNDGASKFRNKMIQEAIIKCYMDFGDYKVFSASIQTMVFVAIKNENPKTYIVKYGKLLDVNAETETLNSFLRNESNQTSKTYIKYPFNFKRANFKDNYINFIPSNLADVIQKIQMRGNSNIKDEEVFSGIDVMQDFVSRMHLQKLRPGYQVGQGIFVLSNEEKESITWNDQEKDIIRPYYTTREINRYYADVKNRYWILYTSVHVNNHVKSYPNIKKHLDQYQDIITSVNRPYGLHRTREECIFSGDKILSIRKCAVPAFSFVDFPCYVSRTFLIIKCPKINMKYLVSLLNSKIVAFWLWHKGKIQGNNYQIDKEPLLQIPLISTNQEDENKILSINNYIVSLRSKMADSSYFERLNNAIIYELYFPDEIKAANAEVLKHLHALPELKEDLSDEKKLKIIEKVYKELSDPQHPVSIALFKMDTIEEIRIIEGKQ